MLTTVLRLFKLYRVKDIKLFLCFCHFRLSGILFWSERFSMRVFARVATTGQAGMTDLKTLIIFKIFGERYHKVINMKIFIRKSLLSSLYQREEEFPSMKRGFRGVSPSFPHSGGFAEEKAKRGSGRFFDHDSILKYSLVILLILLAVLPAVYAETLEDAWNIALAYDHRCRQAA